MSEMASNTSPDCPSSLLSGQSLRAPTHKRILETEEIKHVAHADARRRVAVAGVIGVENFNDIKLGDVLEAFVLEEEATKL